MCGIVGWIEYKSRMSQDQLQRMVQRMVLSLYHRGPDDSGTEIHSFQSCAVGLGHTRLSILDVSSKGRQPMSHYKNTIVYNGEIYNYLELREELVRLGHSFTTDSDTEVILHAYEEWGTNCLDRFIGMFAFCLLDQKKKKVLLVRDRAGVKPLYYYRKDGLILFASELKAFHQNPGFEKVIDLRALSLYLDFGYISAPFTIFKNCYKLKQGHYLEIDLTDGSEKMTQYWESDSLYKRAEKKIDYETAKSELKDLLNSAFNYRMVSDVPVGIFLSGGYDSTAVAAMLQSQRIDKIKTFTIGFNEGNNEALYARKISQHIGSEHTEYYCSEREAQEMITNLPTFFDEPFADSSSIPTLLVSKIAGESVKVVLSADAGDELFGGYNSYTRILSNAKLLERVPRLFHNALKQTLKITYDYIPDKYIRLRHGLDSIHYAIHEDDIEQLVSLFWKSNTLPIYFSTNLTLDHMKEKTLRYCIDSRDIRDKLSALLCIDYKNYLADDILVKVDRATMANSIEGREPFLDHRLLEFVSGLPSEFKHNGKSGKIILKDIVHDYVPQEMLSPSKKGFSVPIYSWLKKDLSFLIDKYLCKAAVRSSHVFDEEIVEKIVTQFRKDRFYYKPLVWKLLVFQMWYEKWMK